MTELSARPSLSVKDQNENISPSLLDGSIFMKTPWLKNALFLIYQDSYILEKPGVSAYVKLILSPEYFQKVHICNNA